MADRPIIFSAPMVRALLEGRKTQTRRVLKPPYGTLEYLGDGTWKPICTKFFRGDRLYVREAHALVPASAYRCSEGVAQAIDPNDADRAVIYRAGFDRCTSGIRWRPSIHMPRWASRLTLHVTDVRVQRLQEISAEDCAREGVIVPDHVLIRDGFMLSARSHFRDLWNSIHGPDAWDANPWVAAITFDVRSGNIDTPTGGTNDRS